VGGVDDPEHPGRCIRSGCPTSERETDVQITLLQRPVPAPPLVVVDLPAVPGDGPTPRAAAPDRRSVDVVEEWGLQSFPASDPPANW
jgi:hypothetical protein